MSLNINIPKNKVIAVAMSGGVDSSVTAAVLKKEGYKVFGITLDILHDQSKDSCVTVAKKDAKAICDQIGIEHYIIDVKDQFKKEIIDDFIESYKNGLTPLPCARCNKIIKFGTLLDFAMANGADYLATGHYVNIKEVDGKRKIFAGDDLKKDQSYYFNRLTQKEIDKIVCPLGEIEKTETREIAKDLGLFVANKKDSQDICFVPNGDYRVVIEKMSPNLTKPGNIVDLKGNVVGQHLGISNFTVGQRKGLGGGFSSQMYVIKINPENDEIVIGEKEHLGVESFKIKSINWIPEGDFDNKTVFVKVRSAHAGAEAVLKKIDDKNVQVTFTKGPELYVSPGQAAVIYDAENKSELLGGGWICR